MTVSDPNPSGCRWIFGDPKEPDAAYCGAPKRNLRSSYCQRHHDDAYLSADEVAEMKREIARKAAARRAVIAEAARRDAALTPNSLH